MAGRIKLWEQRFTKSEVRKTLSYMQPTFGIGNLPPIRLGQLNSNENTYSSETVWEYLQELRKRKLINMNGISSMYTIFNRGYHKEFCDLPDEAEPALSLWKEKYCQTKNRIGPPAPRY